MQLKNKVSVFNNDVVKFSVIHTYLNISLKFINKDHWGTDEECAEIYESFLKILIQSLLKHFKFINDYKI